MSDTVLLDDQPTVAIISYEIPPISAMTGIIATYPSAPGGLSGHRAIAVVSEVAVYADNSTNDHAYLVEGITQSASSSGATTFIYNQQLITESSWNWAPGDPVFLGQNGLLTQAAPNAPPATFVLQIGRAIAPTKVFIQVEQPIFL